MTFGVRAAESGGGNEAVGLERQVEWAWQKELPGLRPVAAATGQRRLDGSQS